MVYNLVIQYINNIWRSKYAIKKLAENMNKDYIQFTGLYQYWLKESIFCVTFMGNHKAYSLI